MPAPTLLVLLTKAELDELETCHSKTPPDTEGVNPDEIVVRSTVVAGQVFVAVADTEGVVGGVQMAIFVLKLA